MRTMASVATAVIEIPDPPLGGEHETADVRLVLTRGGSSIIHKQKYYNVPVTSGGIPAIPTTISISSPVFICRCLPRANSSIRP